MRLRFMRTTPSVNPEAPFQAGQIIALPELTEDARAWIADGAAVVLPEPSAPQRADAPDAPESAMFGAAPEQATRPRSRARGSR